MGGWVRKNKNLYCLIKLFYRTHIPVKSFVGQLLFNATILAPSTVHYILLICFP